jgi:hypothetical protein
MSQAIGAYRDVVIAPAFKEAERLRSLARHNEASALHNAEKRGEERGEKRGEKRGEERGEKRANAKWENVVADKDAAIADKDTAIAEQAAEIAKLRAQLGEDK